MLTGDFEPRDLSDPSALEIAVQELGSALSYRDRELAWLEQRLKQLEPTHLVSQSPARIAFNAICAQVLGEKADEVRRAVRQALDDEVNAAKQDLLQLLNKEAGKC